MLTLRIMARLMGYPDEELYRSLPELTSLLNEEAALPPDSREWLEAWVAELCETPLMQLQQEYVSLFDRGRHLSLHLFEHVHGESRDRGQAMVDLIDYYRSRGLELNAHELPDYLPLFLEFLSTVDDPREIHAMLTDAMPVIVLLGARLREKRSGYALLFQALEALGGSCEEAETLRKQAASEEPDETLEKMDEIWEEEQVTFLGNPGPEGSGCGSEPARPPETPVQWLDNNQARAAGKG